MLGRLVELVILFNALAAGGGFILRRVRRQRRQAQLDYIKRLELENKEIDKSLEQMQHAKADPPR